MNRILIVEDEAPWRERLANDLEDEGYNVSIAASLEAARQLLNQLKPDVVTLDMTLSVYGRKRKQGYALLEELDLMLNSPEVIIVSSTISREEVKSIWQGYDIFDVLLKKNYSRKYFIQTVRDAVKAKRGADAEEDATETNDQPLTASNTGVLLPLTEAEKDVLREVAQGKIDDEPLTGANTDVTCPLTRAEKDVLREVARGKTNKEIAANLKKSVDTVKKQLTTAYEKLEITGRINAVNKARELGCIPREE